MFLTANSLNGLRFCPIFPEEVEVVVCIDAIFALNKDNPSHVRILAMVRNNLTGTVNAIYYVFLKSKAVRKSVLAAKLLALVDGFDTRYTTTHDLPEMMKRMINLIIYTDSRSFYRLCISLAHTAERRLQIDIPLMRYAFERGNTDDII